MPKAIPTNKNPLISPLLNLNIEYNIISPDIIQKEMSSKEVIISLVLNDFLRILNISNNNPIKNPFNTNIKNKYIWFSNLSPYFM